MFCKKGDHVKATAAESTYTGTIYSITIQNCKEDGNRPHALVFISQDESMTEKEGEFGCAALWVDQLLSLELLEPAHT